MTSGINKLADWPPNYHKTARILPKSSALPHSMHKLTLNKPEIKILNCDIYIQPSSGGSSDLKDFPDNTNRISGIIGNSYQ